jgi:hypothetical protein
MNNRRLRPLVFAALALVVVWAATVTAFHFSGKARMTAEKVRQFTLATDLAGLSPAAREQAIADLAARVNALPFDERLKWRRTDEWKKWFAEMTEAERRKFIAATLPTGFKQTLEAFGQLPADQRRQFVADAIQRMREDGAAGINKSVADYGSSGPPPLSPELENQVRLMGLQQFYSDTSAGTKADLAPLLEEMQRQIQGGRP